MKAINCKEGSAWHYWQTAGARWKQDNPDTQRDPWDAAIEFANKAYPHSNAWHARRRAFLEGVLNS